MPDCKDYKDYMPFAMETAAAHWRTNSRPVGAQRQDDGRVGRGWRDGRLQKALAVAIASVQI